MRASSVPVTDHLTSGHRTIERPGLMTAFPQAGACPQGRRSGVSGRRSPYGRLRETLGLAPMRMVSVLIALEVRPSTLVTG